MTSITRRLSLFASTAALALTATLAQAQTFTSVTTPQGIPDSATINNNITVPAGLGIITDVNVSISMNHTFFDDLDVFLTHGSATNIELFSDAPTTGGNRNAAGTYILDDAAAVNILNAPLSGPATTDNVIPGTYTTETGTALSSFNGLDPTGLWTLTISDTAAADVGTLNAWSIILTVAAVDQAKVGPVVQDIIAGDISGVVGSMADRASAQYGSGVQPAADVINPYEAGGKGGLWIRTNAAKSKNEGDIENLFIPGVANYKQDSWFLQGGGSYVLSETADRKWIGSGFVHYGKSSADISDAVGAVGKVDNTGIGAGFASTWLWTNGLYLDSQSLFTSQELDITTSGGATGKTDAFVMASSFEAGMKYNLGGGVSLSPQIQAVYQRINIDSFTDSGANTYSFNDNNSLEGRAGLGLGFGETMASNGYRLEMDLTGSLLRDFLDGGDAVINGTALGYGGNGGTAALVSAGFSLAPPAQGASFSARASYQTPISGNGRDTLSGNLVLGWTF